MSEKKVIVLWAVAKAMVTTALIGFAINRMDLVLSTTDLFTKVFTSGIIGVVCILGTVLYSANLFQKGVLKTTGQFFHTYGISWEENADLLKKSWGESGAIGLLIAISILLAGEGDWGIYPVLISVCFGALTTYIMRRDCISTMHYIKYFVYGYTFGVGMVVNGLLINFLVSIFGVFWVGLLITIDVGFTGAYTYLDLLDWEKEQNQKIEDAKIAAGLK